MYFMIGTHKFTANSIDEALLLAKKKMIQEGWRNLRLMIKNDDEWGVCRVIPSFETKH